MAVCAAAHAGTLPGRPPRVAVQLPLRPRAAARRLRPLRAYRHQHQRRTTLMAWIDWDAALSALHDGQIPLSGGEQRTLQLASIAEGFPISLRDTLPGLDNRDLKLLVTAIRHAAGQHPGASKPSPQQARPATQAGPADIHAKSATIPHSQPRSHRATAARPPGTQLSCQRMLRSGCGGFGMPPQLCCVGVAPDPGGVPYRHGRLLTGRSRWHSQPPVPRTVAVCLRALINPLYGNTGTRRQGSI
jgi:hypothetical protein